MGVESSTRGVGTKLGSWAEIPCKGIMGVNKGEAIPAVEAVGDWYAMAGIMVGDEITPSIDIGAPPIIEDTESLDPRERGVS